MPPPAEAVRERVLPLPLWPSAVAAAEPARERLARTLASTVLPFVLVLYLALKGGGYDAIVRSEVGLAAWWIVLLGSAVGVLPRARLSPAGWLALGLLAAFAAWTALGIGWSDSAERSAAELARMATFLGVLALALAVQGRDGLKRTASAVGAGIAVVASLALLSRLHPGWFPENDAAHFLTAAEARLSYPLNYWNGLAALIAIGIPLVLAIAVDARRIVSRALAAAALPAMALAAFYTFSRGGAVAIAAGLALFLLLSPRRLAALPTVGLGGVGGALLIAAATQRDALEHEPLSRAAAAQGDEMLALVIIVCAGAALLQAAIALAALHGLGPRPRLSPRAAGTVTAAVATAGLVVALAAGLPGELSDSWDEFKASSPVAASGAERFESAAGSGRYQYWSAAVDAYRTEPLHGIGPGTYEYFWAQNRGARGGFVRDAHSLYLETLAELGIVGLALLAAFIAAVLATALRRAVGASRESRAWLAAGAAGCAAFAVAAAIDWVWELAVLPVCFLLLAAALLGHRSAEADASGTGAPAPSGRGPLAARATLAALALASLVAIAIPLAGATEVRESQAAVRTEELTGALGHARDAREIEPYAATPNLQEALVLELRGDLDGAVAAARAATVDEPTNWRTWLVLSRLEAERGNAKASVRAFRRARSLNPRSPLFAPATSQPAPTGSAGSP